MQPSQTPPPALASVDDSGFTFVSPAIPPSSFLLLSNSLVLLLTPPNYCIYNLTCGYFSQCVSSPLRIIALFQSSPSVPNSLNSTHFGHVIERAEQYDFFKRKSTASNLLEFINFVGFCQSRQSTKLSALLSILAF